MTERLSQVVECVHEFGQLQQNFKLFRLRQPFVLLLDQFVQSLVLGNDYAYFQLIGDEKSLWEHDVAVELVELHLGQSLNVRVNLVSGYAIEPQTPNQQFVLSSDRALAQLAQLRLHELFVAQIVPVTLEVLPYSELGSFLEQQG